MKESDMYNPIRKMLTEQGYTVRGEVKGCDIVALKDDAMIIVEMKLSANLTLIYQAMARQTATDWVFIAIPRPRNVKRGTFPKLKKLVKQLNIGLITVPLDSPVPCAEIIIYPEGRASKRNKKAAALKREARGRTIDTTGGTTGTKINTAYRERCIRIACLLEAKGEMTAKSLTALGCEGDTYRILYTNAIGWFTRVSKGVYNLSDAGIAYLSENATSSLVEYYKMKATE